MNMNTSTTTSGKKMFDMGQEIINNSKIRCPQCGTVYTFEPTRWRVLADEPVEDL
jgi:hypothetical protein